MAEFASFGKRLAAPSGNLKLPISFDLFWEPYNIFDSAEYMVVSYLYVIYYSKRRFGKRSASKFPRAYSYYALYLLVRLALNLMNFRAIAGRFIASLSTRLHKEPHAWTVTRCLSTDYVRRALDLRSATSTKLSHVSRAGKHAHSNEHGYGLFETFLRFRCGWEKFGLF